MACIILESPWGKRTVPENTPYQRLEGEQIVGVDWDCGDIVADDEVEKELEKAGIAWGDAIAAVTRTFGIKECSRCTARKHILNKAAELGWSETVRQLKGTFS